MHENGDENYRFQHERVNLKIFVGESKNGTQKSVHPYKSSCNMK